MTQMVSAERTKITKALGIVVPPTFAVARRRGDRMSAFTSASGI